jgi:hypothetical protein
VVRIVLDIVDEAQRGYDAVVMGRRVWKIRARLEHPGVLQLCSVCQWIYDPGRRLFMHLRDRAFSTNPEGASPLPAFEVP